MAAKSSSFLDKSYLDDEDETVTTYSNLILNGNLNSFNLSPVQSFSKSFKGKSYDSDASENCKGKEKSELWNKSSKFSNFSSFNDESNEAKKCWKKSSSNTTANNSTLSLHISAYENSVEGNVSDSSWPPKDVAHKDRFVDPIRKILNPWEFPRQVNDQPAVELLLKSEPADSVLFSMDAQSKLYVGKLRVINNSKSILAVKFKSSTNKRGEKFGQSHVYSILHPAQSLDNIKFTYIPGTPQKYEDQKHFLSMYYIQVGDHDSKKEAHEIWKAHYNRREGPLTIGVKFVR